MCNKLEQVFSQLANAEISNKDNVYTIVVAKENLRQAAETLRNNDIVRFDFLRDIIGMDYTDSLGVIYNLSPSEDLSVIVLLESRTDDRENPAFDTVEDLWLSAPFYEREVHDFFGIRFLGNPDMRRIFLRQDWRGYPLRKDYDSSPIINPIPLENEDLDALEYLPVLDLKDIDKERKSVFDKGDFVVNFGPQHPATHGVLHLRVSLDGEVIKKVDPNFGYIHWIYTPRYREDMRGIYVSPDTTPCRPSRLSVGLYQPPRRLYGYRKGYTARSAAQSTVRAYHHRRTHSYSLSPARLGCYGNGYGCYHSIRIRYARQREDNEDIREDLRWQTDGKLFDDRRSDGRYSSRFSERRKRVCRIYA